MTGMAAMRACFDAVMVNAARLLGLEGYGLEPGCNADVVVRRRAIRSRRSACGRRGSMSCAVER